MPPQAYTREILTAAFNWLQTQPESSRKLATTPDALVGLYMRAQRFGNSSLEADAPISSQNFMSDLKHLAEGLKQFEEGPRGTTGEIRRLHPNTTVSTATMTPPSMASWAAAQQPANTSTVSTASTPVPASLSGSLNEKSWAMIQEVKSQLNLSSDAEAINMMVALAYKSLKNLLA